MAQRWKLVSRRWKAIAAAGALALLALVPLQLATANEQGVPTNPDAGFTIEQGSIVLKMNPASDPNGKSYFQYVAPNGDQKAIQKFASSGRCGITPSANIVAVSALGGSVGYREADNGYGLGVNKNGTEGTGSCTQTNPGESLTLNFDPGLGSNEYLDYALLDMELKYSTTLLTIKLYKGTTDVYTYTRTCTSSDCGPDSGGNDNKLIRVPTNPGTVLFDKMVITATTNGGTQAAATLEGGSDATTSLSSFHVVSPADPIVCGVPVPDSGGGTSVIVTLVDNPGCVDKAIALNTSAREIELLTGGGSGSTEQFLVQVDDWAPELAKYPIPPTLVDPAGVGDNIGTWCEGTPMAYSMPIGEAWCLIDQHAVLAGVDGSNKQLMQVTETWLLEGDARITRP